MTERLLGILIVSVSVYVYVYVCVWLSKAQPTTHKSSPIGLWGSTQLIKNGQNTVPKNTAVLIHLLLIFPCHSAISCYFNLSLALSLLSIC